MQVYFVVASQWKEKSLVSKTLTVGSDSIQNQIVFLLIISSPKTIFQTEVYKVNLINYRKLLKKKNVGSKKKYEEIII